MSTKPKKATRKDLKIATFTDSSGIGHVTEKGFFVDDNGDALINTPDGMLNDGGYDPDIHGLFVPLAKKKQRSKLKIA